MFEYILISAKNRYKHKVEHELSIIDEIVDVEPLITEESLIADPFFEDYNIIAKIEITNSSELDKEIYDKINNVEGVVKLKIIQKNTINK